MPAGAALGRRSDQRIPLLRNRHAFWDWSVAIYARPDAERLLVALQDRHGLSVNMLLWCLWCGANFEAPGELIVRKADDMSRQWSANVTAPLRMARRTLKAPPIMVPEIEREALRERIKAAELEAERLEQAALEKLAKDNLTPRPGVNASSRARKALAAYIRLTDAAKTPGFSVSLLEDLIGLTFPPSESDGERVE